MLLFSANREVSCKDKSIEASEPLVPFLLSLIMDCLISSIRVSSFKSKKSVLFERSIRGKNIGSPVDPVKDFEVVKGEYKESVSVEKLQPGGMIIIPFRDL